MKKLALALLGLFLAGLAITAALHDAVGIVIGVFLALGAFRCFRAVWRLAPAAPSGPRPWER